MRKALIFFFLIAIQSTIYAQKDQYNYFIKTWNFLKYHPDIASGKKDADSLFLSTVENVTGKSDVNSIINLLTANLNHQFSGKPVVDDSKDVWSVNQDFSWYQKNKKISSENKAFLNNVYNHRFIAGPEKKDKAADDKNKDQFKKDENLPLAYRLLTFAKIQGTIDYLYPHKYLMDKNSEAYFADLLDQTIRCSSRKDFEIILAKAVAKMEDSHAFSFYEQLNYKNEIFHRSYYPPFDYTVFDDYILITYLILPELCTKANIQVGDRITEINGKNIRQLIKEKEELLSTSNHETLLYRISDYQKNLIWPDDRPQKELKIQSKQKTYRTTIDYTQFTDKQQQAKVSDYIKGKIRAKNQHKIIDHDIAYFKIDDVYSLTENIVEDQLDDHMDQIFKEASAKKAIVFDMRGYPDWGGFVFYYVYKYFSPVNNYFGKYYKPNVKNTGTYIPISYKDFGVYYHEIKDKTVHPYKGKVFIIVNPKTLSMSEWNTMNLQNIFPQAITIGQKTAGADGDIITVPLPANYNLVFTGNGIFYYDHSQTQKVGVKINELIQYTDDDIIQNRDLEFERVLKAVK